MTPEDEEFNRIEMESRIRQEYIKAIKPTVQCPNCEYHKERARIWREEAYRLAGYPLPKREDT